MKNLKSKITHIVLTLAVFLVAPVLSITKASAASITMSPMNQRLVVAPDDSISSSFTISNPGTATSDAVYSIDIRPFYVDENYNSVFNEPGAYSEIVDWITIDSPRTGVLAPNQYAEINFTINVPANAPSGGQYAAIVATLEVPEQANGTSISEKQAAAHIIFAEVTGETVKQGEITEASVPSFLLSGNITASATIKNTGNVHGVATYALRVTPVFGGDDLYNNEEDPEVHTIVPDRTFLNEITVDNTPPMGLFNVVYTVNFEGVTTTVSKLVIICPIWLLFVLAIGIAGLITAIVFFFRAGRR